MLTNPKTIIFPSPHEAKIATTTRPHHTQKQPPIKKKQPPTKHLPPNRTRKKSKPTDLIAPNSVNTFQG